MAYRYNAVDQDNMNEKLTAILNAIQNLLKAWGAKNVKPHQYKRTVEQPKSKNKGDIITGGVTNMTKTEIVDQSQPKNPKK